jgi:hypothetical protein
MIDKARFGGLPKLSQTQMATKAIIDGLRFQGAENGYK